MGAHIKQTPVSRGCTIAGWGTALPDREVTNADIATLVDTSDDWIFERSGIRSRRVLTGPFSESTSNGSSKSLVGTTASLAVTAARKALHQSQLTADDVGMLILCTGTPDMQMPATSAIVAAELGLRAGAMDLNAVCSGFMHGMVTSASMIAAGVNTVLLIASETMTRVTNWTDRSSVFLFGDGAAALVLSAVDGPGSLMSWDLGVDGTLANLFTAEHGSTMEMKGAEVFRHAVRVCTQSARTAMERSGVNSSQIGIFVPHQANLRIMHAIADRLDIPRERVASTIEWTGNTSSASIPIALINAVENGRIEAGDFILFAGFGAGMSWGSAVWRWDTDRL
jgi:3-oxoacyl-[acyl-carrier-protein] synthase III